MPDATGGGIESLLITFAGVKQNNELSSQYNVRGGSFDENSVYVNGLEVHRPLLIRSGQQEGLSFVNTDMVESVDFSAGGFDAQYGDKMSSVLDIRYKRPTKLESRLSMSLLGANAYIGWGDSTQSQMHGIRYKTSKYMLGALDTKGNYKPNFLDYQTQMTWKVGASQSSSESPQKSNTFSGAPQGKDFNSTRDWEIRFLGNFSQNSYEFIPDSSATNFGGIDAKEKKIYHEGQEKDIFRTAFAALSAEGKVNREVTVGVDLSGFYSHEQETYDILSEYMLYQKDMSGENNNSGKNPNGELADPEANKNLLGSGAYHEHARNMLRASMVTLAHTGEWKRGSNSLKWGMSGSIEMIQDRISEWEWRDSLGYSLPNADKDMLLFYAMKGTTHMQNGRLQAYAQNTHHWNTDLGKVYLTAGMRLNWWSFTNEVLPSPRVSMVWLPGWKRDMTFRVATGVYYQAPLYKELRQTMMEDGIYRIHLNNQLKAQRSYQLVIGTDYYFRAWGRPFKFTAEAYGKYIDRMESYTVDNVRVRYSGVNDSEGYTIGLDAKLMGELVPGVDSWVSFSTMRSRMRFVDDKHNLGWIPTPQEQRYNVTVYFQDYLPQLPQYKLHLKFIWSEGLPFGYPRREDMRYLRHISDYKRIDIGASRTFSGDTDKWMKKSKHVESWSVQFDVFNLVDWHNVNSYYWVTAADGMQWACPNYLTGRMFNLKVDVRIK